MMSDNGRSAALVNGALMALGGLTVVDNVVAHWILGLHRAVPGAWATPLEVGLVVLGIVVFFVGMAREIKARRR